MTHEIEEMMSEMSDIKEIKKTLISWLKGEVNDGKERFDTSSCGDVSDIIKDMAETTKACYEALYYKTVVEAMNSGERPSYGEDEVYGYNHRHTKSGKFASTGKGHPVYGYRPFVDHEPYIDGYLHDPNYEHRIRTLSMDPMGYNPSDIRHDMSNRSKHGETYDNYRRAMRNYHETRSQADKEEMDAHHMMYMEDTINNLCAMWKEADPMLKKKMKEDFGEEIAEVLDKM